MDEKAAQDAVGRIVEVLRAAGRSEATVRRHRAVLERFGSFLIGRGLDAASEGVCIDFIATQQCRGAALAPPWGQKMWSRISRLAVGRPRWCGGRVR